VPIPTLTSTPMKPERFKNALLRRVANPEWEQDLKYIRSLYDRVKSELWDQMSVPSEGVGRDQALYQSTEPVMRELVIMLRSVADAAPQTQDAVRDFDAASSLAEAGDYEKAILQFGQVLMKVHNLLNGKTKLGYGYDIGGQVQQGGGTSGEGRHLWDTGNSPKHDHTTNNPANMMYDAEAESDYPELLKFKHKRVHWPPRIR